MRARAEGLDVPPPPDPIGTEWIAEQAQGWEYPGVFILEPQEPDGDGDDDGDGDGLQKYFTRGAAGFEVGF